LEGQTSAAFKICQWVNRKLEVKLTTMERQTPVEYRDFTNAFFCHSGFLLGLRSSFIADTISYIKLQILTFYIT